jgi:hypothetical protein
LRYFSTKYGKELKGISRRAQIFLTRHPWPGNVRELENVIGNACIMAQGKIVCEDDLPEAIRAPINTPKTVGFMTLQEVQVRHLEYILKIVEGNKARAAEILGVSRAPYTTCWRVAFVNSIPRTICPRDGALFPYHAVLTFRRRDNWRQLDTAIPPTSARPDLPSPFRVDRSTMGQ